MRNRLINDFKPILKIEIRALKITTFLSGAQFVLVNS